MSPRKSASSNAGTDVNGDVSMVSNATASSSTTHAHPKPSRQSSGSTRQDADGVGIDDLLLPRTLIQRLARGVLPPNTSIQRDAVLALSKSATVFISYLAHHANEQSTRKTLSPQDVLKALKEIEFANVMELGAVGKDGRLGGRLERELELYEEALMQKRKGARDRKSNKARESTGAAVDGGDEAEEDERGEPSSKKARRMDVDDDDDPDEDDRMLDLQLNGTEAGDGTVQPASASATGRQKRNTSASGSSPVANGKGKSRIEDTESEAEPDQDEEEQEEDDDDDDENDEDDDEARDDEENDDEDAEVLPEETNGNRSRYGHVDGRFGIDTSEEESD